MMLQLDQRMIKNYVGKDLIAFGTGGIGKIVIPYLAQEPDIKIHGVTNSRVTAVDAGMFLDTKLPIRSLDTWAKLMPDATVLLCVVPKNEVSAWEACRAAGFRNIMQVPFDLIEMLQDIFNPTRLPVGSPMFPLMCMANELRDIHKASFSEFKDCHRRQTVAVIATGPSMNHYTPIKNIPHIGVNTSFLRDDLQLDYYFLCHYIPEWGDKLKDYHFIKFFGRNEMLERFKDDDFDIIPEYFVEENNARRFFTGEPHREIYADISYYPLMGYYSTTFRAIHFATYTRAKRILLVGCDCTHGEHYQNFDYEEKYQKTWPKLESKRLLWIEGFKTLKKFVTWHYPDMEIISVNPSGLKGIFRDVYTESYLEAHSELDRAKCEILDPADFEGK